MKTTKKVHEQNVKILMKKSEWHTLSPAAQELLFAAGRRAVELTRKQRTVNAKALAEIKRSRLK